MKTRGVRKFWKFKCSETQSGAFWVPKLSKWIGLTNTRNANVFNKMQPFSVTSYELLQQKYEHDYTIWSPLAASKQTGYDCFQIWQQAHGKKQWKTTWLYLPPFIPQAIPCTLIININVKQDSNPSGRISQQGTDAEIKGKQKYEHHRKYCQLHSARSAETYLTSDLTQDNICYAFTWWE